MRISLSLIKSGLLILIIFVVSGTVFSQDGGNPDSVIARVWLVRADQLLSSESLSDSELKEAASALAIAAEYQIPGRDALYLKAKLLISGYKTDSNSIGESSIRQAYTLLTESLDAGAIDFFQEITRFEDRAVLWSSMALRLKDYRRMLDRYRKWPRGHRDDPLLVYAAARAALYLGLVDQAGDLAVIGESLSIPGTDLGALGPSFRGSAETAFRAIAVAAGNTNSIITLDAAFRHWGMGLENALRPWLLSGYISVPDTGNLEELLSINLKSSLELITGSGEPDMVFLPEIMGDLALLRRIRIAEAGAGDVSGKDLVDRNLDSYTGRLTADSDYDGYPEEILWFVNGKPKDRKIDSDQDGQYEWEIVYEDSRPWHVIIDEGSLELLYEQAHYPSLLSITRNSDNVRVDLSLHPGGYSWETENPDGFWAEPIMPLDPDWNEDNLWYGTRVVNVRVDNTESNGYGESVTYLSSGYPLRAVEKQYSAGIALWTREIIYDGAVPAAGRRSFRMDPDNPQQYLWELYERYENGELVGLAWDPGMTGTPAYLRDWALQRYLETQIWDLDSDSWVDVRRFILPNGNVQSKELMITQARREDLLPWDAADWAPWEQ